MTIRQRVENILRLVPATRNSDTELQIVYMQKAGMELTDKQKQLFRDLPSMETIRRVRQKIQEEGKYPATKEVEQARYEKFKQTRQTISASNSDQTEFIVGGKYYKVLDWGE